jgi:predicted RNA binding protein YcfA (HicA-like mRNA interferase family)
MSGRLPTVSGRRVVRALQDAGFILDRIVGSHHILAHPDDPKRAVTVPLHSNRDLKPGTLRSILRQAGLTAEEMRNLL